MFTFSMIHLYARLNVKAKRILQISKFYVAVIEEVGIKAILNPIEEIRGNFSEFFTPIITSQRCQEFEI